MELLIREATENDLPAIVEIYNQSIPAGWSTADTRPITIAERVEWFRKFDPARRPIWVAEADSRVVATAYLRRSTPAAPPMTPPPRSASTWPQPHTGRASVGGSKSSSSANVRGWGSRLF